MKQTKFLFKFLALLIILVYSCREELSNQNISPAQRNKTDFFKRTTNTQKTAAKIGIDYISILEEYNEKTNFISSIEDQKGLPNWEKMQVLKRNKEITLYIPLSYNNTSLSSLILVNIDDRKNVYALKNFTNNFLKNYVYNNNYPADKRKFLMDTFMAMDYMTFGNQQFTNLPLDLYKGVGEYNSLNVLNTTIENDISSKFIYETTCLTLHSCVNGCSLASCDYANCSHGGKCFVIKSCTTTTTWEDTGGYDPQHGGDNGGLGGGGGTPGPQPPKDPCTTQDDGGVFYRLIPGCTPNNEENEDPCERTKDLLENEIIRPKINSLIAHANSGGAYEKGWKFNKIGSPTEAFAVSNHSVSAGMPNLLNGFYHNHTGKYVDIFSATDIATLIEIARHQDIGKTEDAFVGVVAPNNIHYIITFKGIHSNLPIHPFEDLKLTNWNNQLWDEYLNIITEPNLTKNEKLEIVFFSLIQKMNLQNNITLQRIDNNNLINTIHQNSDKIIIYTPCL